MGKLMDQWDLPSTKKSTAVKADVYKDYDSKTAYEYDSKTAYEYDSTLEQANALELDKAVFDANRFVRKYYLNELASFETTKPSRRVREIKTDERVRLFRLSGMVYNKDENILERLNNVYSALHSMNLSLIFWIVKSKNNVELYIGIKTKEDISEYRVLDRGMEEAFEDIFSGSFPGSDISMVSPDKYDKMLSTVLPKDGSNSVSALTALPSLKSDVSGNDEFTQGIEKVIDALNDEEYSIMIISDPVDTGTVEYIKRGYEELYTELKSLMSYELTLGKSDSVNVSNGEMKGFTRTVGESVSKTQSFASGTSHGVNESRTNTIGVGFGGFGSSGVTQGSTESISANAGVGIPFAKVGISAAYSVMRSVSSTLGLNLNTNASTAKTRGTTDTTSKTNTYGTGSSRLEQESETTQLSRQSGISEGSNTATTLTFENRTIKELLETIDAHLERLKSCANYGMWSNAAYFISPSRKASVVAANTYKGIISGEETGLEISSVNTWFKDESTKNINEYLKKFEHPKFYDPNYLTDYDAIPEVYPTTMISTKELSVQCGMPFRSISGMYVREMAEFGRNVFESGKSGNEHIALGKIYHMGKSENNDRVYLDVNRLSEHVFVTGSTGSGKSNTVYNIISQLNGMQYSSKGLKRKIPTLIIEPAKGEYKQMFGKYFNVYGTNPFYTPLLRINPFKFEKNIHVLEHIDRMIDIFNVCWPMYAAMPAVLKEAIEKAYVNAGWDLDTSENRYKPTMYPCFTDVLEALRTVIARSDYSQEVKDNYTGSLITRVKSLTNGINGQIFTSDELSMEELFEQSAIVDLSRVGSSETKSMIMGILIMRLQEYRMSKGGINRPLEHMTVIEEAHNLLKRTSFEQNSESSNLMGKSVEMIANAIAEMRTYGEGFVIVDQAPGLLDMSAIRNTNTKIVMKLPEYSDRESAGKSMGLNESQITELAKLPTGVAAVYQSKWVEPVLCMIDYYASKPEQYVNKSKEIYSDKSYKQKLVQYILSDISKEKPESDTEYLKKRLMGSNLSVRSKLRLSKYLDGKRPDTIGKAYREVMDCIDDTDKLLKSANVSKSIEQFTDILYDELSEQYADLSDVCIKNIIECMLYAHSLESRQWKEFYDRWAEYNGRGIY